MWARVFAAAADAPALQELVDHLRAAGHRADARADADDLGWFHLDLATNAGNVVLDRYGAEEGIRDELNSWAAWLEIHAGEQADRLMQQMISSQQIITLRCDREMEDELRRLLHGLLGFLATATGGVYQVDDEGFFDAAGALLVAENETDA